MWYNSFITLEVGDFLGKIIAIANQKGGVGKTTTCVNLCAGLAMLGKKTLLIDIDPQGNATRGVGIEKKSINYSVYEVIIGEKQAEQVIIKTQIENLFIMPTNMNLAGAEIELVVVDNREYKLKQAIEKQKEKFDFILIDCPPSLGLLTLNSLIAADSVIIPIQCEFYALEGLSQLTNTIARVKKSLNTELKLEGVILTMFDSRTNLSIQVVDEVKKFFNNKVYKTIIPRNVRLSEAPSYGIPIFQYDKTSKGAMCYLELAEEIINQNKVV